MVSCVSSMTRLTSQRAPVLYGWGFFLSFARLFANYPDQRVHSAEWDTSYSAGKLLTQNDPPKNRNFFVGYVDASLSFRVLPNAILAPAMHKIGAKKEPPANTRLGFFGVASI